MTNPDFRDLLAAFCDADARFIIVGGYAVTFHAQPRFTKDLDVWVDPSGDNPVRVHGALRAFGAPMADVSPDDFANPEIVFQVGVPPNRVDVLSGLSGLEFDGAWGRRVKARYGDVEVAYLSREDLIANKRASGRPQDLVDADVLERLDSGG